MVFQINPLVQHLALCGVSIVGPQLFYVDQCDLPMAIHCVLQGRDWNQFIFTVTGIVHPDYLRQVVGGATLATMPTGGAGTRESQRSSEISTESGAFRESTVIS
jgi:hypothetical protein